MPAGMPPNMMELMSDPRFMQMAQQFVMANPQLRELATQVAQNPEMMQQMMQGQMPTGVFPENFSDQLASAFEGVGGMAGLQSMMGGAAPGPGGGPPKPSGGGMGGMGGFE